MRLGILFIVIINCNICFSQTGVRQVGLDENRFYTFQQQKTNWCWAASIQMVLFYNHIIVEQPEIVQRTVGANYNGEIPNLGGSVQMISNNLNKWQLDIVGRQTSITSDFIPHAPSAEEMIENLKKQQPIYLSYKSSLSTNHAIVITSCRYIETAKGYEILDFTVRDPWPSPENLATKGTLKYSYKAFYPLMNFFWIIALKVSGNNIASSKDLSSCQTAFCTTLAKILNGFNNSFIEIKQDAASSTISFRSKLKFQNEIFNHISNGEYPSYFADFYDGSNYDSSFIIYQQLKAELNFIIPGLEESSIGPRLGQDVNEAKSRENKYINILWDDKYVLRLTWGYNFTKEHGRVELSIMTKEYAQGVLQF